MTRTDDFVVVTVKIKDILEAAQTELGLKKVNYGDQNMIPDFPVACVESYPMDKELVGTHQFGIKFNVGIIIHFQKIGSSELTRLQTEQITRAVEKELDKNKTLDGLVAFGYVNRIDPGVSLKEGAMIQSTRLIWQALSRKTFE